jgi:signal transduction histidine kinase
MPEELAFKAHARLLTMLGEQLIKNERIALVEIVKNSYDADARRVFVDFRGFGENFEVNPSSSIVITDDGFGMAPEIVRNTWMAPATPSKAQAKRTQPRTPLGRAIQGEKGIGRFATFKLGNQLSVVSRASGDSQETTLLIDISELDDTGTGSAAEDLYLGDIGAMFDTTAPAVFDGSGLIASDHGTQLEIRGLRAAWNEKLVRAVFDDIGRLEPVMWSPSTTDKNKTFDVTFYRNGVDLQLDEARNDDIQALLDRAVLRVQDGEFSAARGEFSFSLNGRTQVLRIDDPEVRGLKVFREHFLPTPDADPDPKCGPFGFEFFVFDFSATAPAEYSLDREEKALLKRHRVYLYRDGIRVYPYGDPGDDWLQIDVIRGTQSARSMFSNDQTAGFVSISQEHNPRLRDKTNREGLLEDGVATEDFVALIQTILAYLRAKPYERYSAANRRARERNLKGRRVDQFVSAMRQTPNMPASATKTLDALEDSLSAERELATLRISRTEQLAGVGLSVETASHDLIAAGQEALRLARRIVDDLRLHDLMNEPIFALAKALVSRLEFVVSRFADVQGLFVSTRQKKSRIDILQITRRVRSMYSALHDDQHIKFDIDDTEKLSAETTEGALLQCIINLVDNATYWLMTSPHEPRQIRAYVAEPGSLVITDSGPGVKDQDAPFIFEPFYSGKGDEGKGLGLYIAHQNGLRNGFKVELAESPQDEKALEGATFIVTFDSEVKQ